MIVVCGVDLSVSVGKIIGSDQIQKVETGVNRQTWSSQLQVLVQCCGPPEIDVATDTSSPELGGHQSSVRLHGLLRPVRLTL